MQPCIHTALPLLLLLLLLLLPSLPQAATLRGATPDQAAQLSAGITCIQRDAPSSPPSALPPARINDNYCHCLDGRDEPGTSACANGVFSCANRPARPTTIPSSRVDDGYCDCCDGSDEPPTVCPNNCAHSAKRDADVARQKAAAILKGVATRQRYAADAIREQKDDAKELARLQAQLKQVEYQLAEGHRRADALRKRKEYEDKIQSAGATSDTERPPYSPPPAAPAEAHHDDDDDFNEGDLDEFEDDDYDYAGEEDLEAHDDTLEDDDGDDDDDDDDDDDVVPRNVDQINDEADDEDRTVQEPATEEVHAPVAKQGESEASVNEVDSTEPDADHAQQAAPSPEEIDEPEPINVDALCAEVGGSPNIIVQKVQYLRAVIRSQLHRILPNAFPSRAGGSSENLGECVRRADSAKWDLESKKRDLQSKIKEITKKQNVDYGSDSALRRLHGKCTKKKFMQYEFELCPFDLVKQYEHGSAIATLGRFSGWEGEGTEKKMLYTKGDHCWNGPARSTKVQLTCGEVEDIISVDEPNRCTYLMKFITPAVCEQDAADAVLASLGQGENASKDEL